MPRMLAIMSILLVQLLAGQQMDHLTIDEQIEYHIFNASYADAAPLIDEQLALHPDSPKYYYLRSKLAFYSRYFDDTGLNRDSLREMVGDNATKAIEAAERSDETPETRLYEGAAYSLLSRYHVIRRSLYDAFFSARKGRSILEDLLEDHPDMVDAQLHLGVLNYFTATRLTGWQSSLAWLLGMLGDREQSLQQLERVAIEGRLNQTEAVFILGQIHRFFDPNLEEAERLLGSLSQSHPDNTFIHGQHRAVRFSILIDREGPDYLLQNLDTLREDYTLTDPNVLNGLGYNYVTTEDFATAEKIFRANLELFPDYANGYDSLGECLMRQGKNQEAIENLRTGLVKLDADTLINDEFREQVREAMNNNLRSLNAL